MPTTSLCHKNISEYFSWHNLYNSLTFSIFVRKFYWYGKEIYLYIYINMVYGIVFVWR